MFLPTLKFLGKRGVMILDNRLSVVSYTLAAVAGICFVQGLVILTGEGDVKGE